MAGQSLSGKRRRSSPKRERCHPSRYRYVRRVDGVGCYQARVPIGPTKADALNLGTYTTAAWGSATAAEWAAGRAAQEFVKAYQPGRDAWDVVRELQVKGIVPIAVLPRWVYRLPDGTGYGARSRREGSATTLGPFDTPEAAYAAISAWMTRPRWPVTPWASVTGGWAIGRVCRPGAPADSGGKG